MSFELTVRTLCILSMKCICVICMISQYGALFLKFNGNIIIIISSSSSSSSSSSNTTALQLVFVHCVIKVSCSYLDLLDNSNEICLYRADSTEKDRQSLRNVVFLECSVLIRQ
jgi:hypothetical protein